MENEKPQKIKNIALTEPTKMSSKTTIKAREMLEQTMGKIEEIGRQIISAESERDNKIAAIKNRYQKKIDVLKIEAAKLFDTIAQYAHANRNEILPPNRKSVSLVHGILGWKFERPSIEMRAPEKNIVEYLKANGFKQYIKIKHEETVDMEKIKRNPALAHLLFLFKYNEARETFFIKPAGIQVKFTRIMKETVAKIITNLIK